MPITSFALGTWQVYRLKWKKGLIERYTKNLQEPPIILPKDVGYQPPLSPTSPPNTPIRLNKTRFMFPWSGVYCSDRSVEELDHRTVLVRGRFRHDQEMLVGPRTRDGILGYHVITPIERDNGSFIQTERR